MAETTTDANNKTVSYKRKPGREMVAALKPKSTKKRAKSAINRGLISNKAAKRHLGGY
jgi:hypothetical protein